MFGLLDDAMRRPLIWLAAPAGSGKTTLAASYLKARQRPFLWLQLDADNADPASFVYYLRLAGQRHARRHVLKLPLLTPEYRSGLPAFAKRLFASLAEVLPANAVLVFDNYQEVGGGAPLHGFLAEGLMALPAGMHILCSSRQPPPAAYARRRAEGALAFLDWDALRFTPEETAAVATLHCATGAALAPDVLRQLHERTAGWAAGVMLLLELLKIGSTFAFNTNGCAGLSDYTLAKTTGVSAIISADGTTIAFGSGTDSATLHRVSK